MTELIATARRLLGTARRPPTQSDLRRAVSTAYYALFDALARFCADEIVGTAPAGPRAEAWVRVYRALNHGRSETVLDELEPRRRNLAKQGLSSGIDPDVEAFGDALEQLRGSRNEADYDPQPLGLTRAGVELLIDAAERALVRLSRADPAQRRLFALACIVPKRKA